MDLKRWLHVVAAVIGVSLAALIVFLVFGRASSQNTIEGTAPGQPPTACGTIGPAGAAAPPQSDVDRAAGALPSIIDERGIEVVPSKRDQIRWFARVHAASGLCATEIAVRSKEVLVTVIPPDRADVTTAGAYALATVDQTFTAPLARDVTRITIDSPEAPPRIVRVSRRAWSAFEAMVDSGNQPRTVAGLTQSARRSGYGKQDVRTSGW
jgi:hypothetical protein